MRRIRYIYMIAMAVGLSCAMGAQEMAKGIEQEITFSNGDVQLSGTVIVPPSPRPVPGIVFVHGSGPMTRAGFRPYAKAFARLGVASLFYDKRGTGSSGGSWVRASLDDLARDALAAVDALELQKGVDARRIGFWGVSQAGWIMPRAAALSGKNLFMIAISGGGASPLESERFSYGQEFEKYGLSRALQTEAFAVIDQYFDYLVTGQGRDQLAARLEHLQKDDHPLAPLGEQLSRILPSAENRSNWSWVATYDPLPDIAKVKGPVLLMFGDQDREQPTDLAIKRWREGLARSGSEDVTVVVFPGAGHGIRLSHSSDGNQRAPFADGYEELLLGWLWKHVVLAQH